VYSKGFWIQLPTLKLKWNKETTSEPKTFQYHSSYYVTTRILQIHKMANVQPVQQKVIVDSAAQGADAQLAKQILANTNMTLKQEVVKLPEFYGQPEKDTISALDFISRIAECQISNEWNDVRTFSNFRLDLRGQADKWLTSTVCHLSLTVAQRTKDSH